MRISNMTSTRRSVMFLIALFSCFQIIIGFILITSESREVVASNDLGLKNIAIADAQNYMRYEP